MKKAWILVDQCVLSFHEIPDSEVFIAVESDFWVHVLNLSQLGFLLQ